MITKKGLRREIAELRERVAELEAELKAKSLPQVVMTMNGKRLDAALSRQALSRGY